MISPEVKKLAAQCIVDYLGGHNERLEKLIDIAMKLNGEMTCKKCGKVRIPCLYGHKGNKVHGYYCTSCGEITLGNKVVREGRRSCKQLA